MKLIQLVTVQTKVWSGSDFTMITMVLLIANEHAECDIGLVSKNPWNLSKNVVLLHTSEVQQPNKSLPQQFFHDSIHQIMRKNGTLVL